MNCQDQIYSEEYSDFIGNRSLIESKYALDCKQPLGAMFASLYLKLSDGYEDGTVYGYYNIPKLFGLQDTGSMEASGILQVRENPDLKLDGSGVLIGFVDTGIDYAGSIFLKQDGTTRVIAIWDQTIPAESPIRLPELPTTLENITRTPEGFLYGSEFTHEQLNAAVKMEDAYEGISSRDENGHGTFLASIAAGN